MDEDFEADFEALKAKAEAGDAEDQFNLGREYGECAWREQDFNEAVKWYRKAAEQGHAEAQFALGASYGMFQARLDYVNAYTWWNIAAANGFESGKEWKAKLAKFMTNDQIAKAQDLSREMVEANPKLMGD